MCPTRESDLDRALANVSASSAGGAPFLLAFGLTLGLTGLAAFVVPVRVAALITLFQGNAALPLAFWLERRMGTARLAPGNPLRPLSIQMAMSQVVALPAVLLLYALAPWTVPAGMAALGGGHFLPYAWLQRTRAYLVLGGVVSVGSCAMAFWLREATVPWTLLFVAAAYGTTAVVVRRRAAALVRRDTLAVAA